MLDYFHKRAVQILTPEQVAQVRQASLDLVKNVHIEMLRIRGIEVPGVEPDQHTRDQITSERQIVEEHVRHWIDRVERMISMPQMREFAKLTNECKDWVTRELQQTQQSLTALLSREQMVAIQTHTRELQQALSSVI